MGSPYTEFWGMPSLGDLTLDQKAAQVGQSWGLVGATQNVALHPRTRTGSQTGRTGRTAGLLVAGHLVGGHLLQAGHLVFPPPPHQTQTRWLVGLK